MEFEYEMAILEVAMITQDNLIDTEDAVELVSMTHSLDFDVLMSLI